MPLKPSSSSRRLQGLLRLMRPRQWVKNGFVLAPLVFTGSFTDLHAVLQALLAMVLFCVASSATYIVNDLRDIEQDRKHPRKSRTRPLAAGLVTVRQALLLLLVLYVLLLAAWPWAPQVLPVIVAYLVLNLAYSYYLKHQPVLDIFTIAIGFVLRVWGGAQALQVPISSWMFVTTLCLALYLAALKRRQELLQTGTEARAVLQKYSVSLVERYAEISATGALLFYSMFVMSVRPQLVVSIPLVLFGLFRYWYVVEKLDGGESPTDALLSDLPLLLTVLAWVLVCLWALAGLKG
ncbi:MAG: decaprenyl-phosphate phosphoribosyltransferase [Comamonas sp.]